MQHPSLNFVLRNPDGTISLLSQPHLANKRYMQCPKCPTSVVYTQGQKSTHCPQCQKKVKLPQQPKRKTEYTWTCKDCQREAQLYCFAGLTIQRCQQCRQWGMAISY